MPYHAAIFDLDGTLADTLADIAAAGNHVLAAFDKPPIAVDRYRYLAGQGLAYLITHALGPELQHHIPRGVELFREYYAEHKYDSTCSYPGIDDLLRILAGRGLKLAVLSNKPDQPTVDMVRHLFGDHHFHLVRGHREGAPLKPDPAVPREMIWQLDLEPAQCVYVGDTKVDMLTGKSAGMLTVGVTWGFRDEMELRDNGADAIIHQPDALLPIVEAHTAA